MIDTNPPEERETISSGERTTRRLTALLEIAEKEFRRHAAARQFGREIAEAEEADTGRERTRHQALLDELDKPPHRPGWWFYQTPDIGYRR